MLAAELKTLLAGASPEALRLVRAARERDVTILQEFINTSVSKVPHVDAMYRMQTEIFQMGPPPVPEPAKTYELDPRGGWIKCLKCGRTSHHPEDVSEKYCVSCHHFHEP